MLRWYFHPYYLEHSAEILEYIKGACEISTLYRSSRPLFHRGLVLHTYCRFISMTLPEDFLSLHLGPLSSRRKREGDYVSPSVLCMTWSGRTDDACHLRQQQPAHVVSPLPSALPRKKEGRTTIRPDRRTVGRSDGRTASVSNGSSQSA